MLDKDAVLRECARIVFETDNPSYEAIEDLTGMVRRVKAKADRCGFAERSNNADEAVEAARKIDKRVKGVAPVYEKVTVEPGSSPDTQSVMITVSDEPPGGSTPSPYALPEGATELQDLIEHRKMNFARGNIFKASYRSGTCSHSDELRDMRKIKWFADREIARLERK